MVPIRAIFVLILVLWPQFSHATAVGHLIADPIAPETDYFQIANSRDAPFKGLAASLARSTFAGGLSFTSGSIRLAPGRSDDASDTGGFDGVLSQAIALLGNGIHSGLSRSHPRGSTSDRFVPQGGDSRGFDSGDAFELHQASGVSVFAEAVSEPASMAILAASLSVLQILRSRRRRRV